MTDIEQLKHTLSQADKPLFAVLDGAQFGDLPAALLDGGFFHQSLYLDRGDGNRERLATAPHLVWLDRERQGRPDMQGENGSLPVPELVDRLLNMVGKTSAAVFWQCEAGGDILYRHLRTINMILVPDETETDYGKSYEASPLASAEDAGNSMRGTNKGYVPVLFRHADANVMAQVLPSLSHAQRARLFGPADAIAFLPDASWSETSGMMEARREEDLQEPGRGMLKLEKENIDAIGISRDRATARNIAAYLRDVSAERGTDMQEDKLQTFAMRSLKESRGFGVETEAGHCRWAYMSLVTSGQLGRNPSVREVMQADAPGYTADMRVTMLMRQTIASLKNQAARENG